MKQKKQCTTPQLFAALVCLHASSQVLYSSNRLVPEEATASAAKSNGIYFRAFATGDTVAQDSVLVQYCLVQPAIPGCFLFTSFIQ